MSLYSKADVSRLKGMAKSQSGNVLPADSKVGQIQQFTPEQMQLFQQMFANSGPDSYLSKLAGGDQSLFQEMEAPALKQFSEFQGGLASRFSGMGGLGARKSSGFQNTANQAASDFASQLQSNRQGLQRQAIQDLHGMSMDLLNQRPYEKFLIDQEKKKSGWGGLVGAGIGAAAGAFAGMPIQGAQLGYGVGSQF